MSSASQITADAVTWAFDQLGGEPEAAVNAARGWTYGGWVTSQAAQAGAASGAAAILPGLHIPALVADLAFLLHKMAYCSWGVGEINNCVVLGKADFQNIRAVWSGASTPEELPFRAISKAAFTSALVGGSVMVGGVSVAAIAGTAVGQRILVQLAQKAGEVAAKQILLKAAGKGGAKTVLAGSGQFVTKLSGKLAAKVGAKFGTKLGAKGLLGWIPLIGAAASAAINAYFIKSIASSAWDYYSAAER
jgi:hypothetical protein